MRPVIAFCLSLLLLQRTMAHEYRIRSAAELLALNLAPGDKVILQEGDWAGQQLLLKGRGTEAKPILLTVAKPGAIKLTGASSLVMEGEWLVADGLYFTEGYNEKQDVVVFREGSSHCRLTNSSIADFNHPDKKVDYRWVSLYGHHNRVDHCYFSGKTHQGPTMVVWLSDKPNYHSIDHNYFGPRPELGVNGGETIRIGTSTWSMYDSYTRVEENIFEHCDGELEIISNKSCHNTICNNLFYESKGTLTLRHGNYAQVYGNYFIGNGVPETGGIRIIGEHHDVHDNYLQDLTSTGVKAAISMVDGIPNSPLNGYWQVKDARIRQNTIVNCRQAFCIGVGKTPERNLPPLSSSVTGNLVFRTPALITWVDSAATVSFENNMAYGTGNDSNIKGVSFTDPQMKRGSEGIWQTAGGSNKAGAAPVDHLHRDLLQAKDIGPSWMQPVGRLPVKIVE